MLTAEQPELFADEAVAAKVWSPETTGRANTGTSGRPIAVVAADDELGGESGSCLSVLLATTVNDSTSLRAALNVACNPPATVWHDPPLEHTLYEVIGRPPSNGGGPHVTGRRGEPPSPLFKAEAFDPDQWAELFAQSGAQYVVLTANYHDGVCLWPSSYSWNWNSVDVGPHRDLVGDLSAAVRSRGLMMGYYYSLYEWYNPLYRGHLPDYVVLTPVFWQNKVVAFMGTVAHLADVGGHRGDIEAYDVFTEGIRIPPLKLRDAGEIALHANTVNRRAQRRLLRRDSASPE